MRQPKSQSPFDLIAVRGGEVWLVQAKLGGRLRPKEREELVALAEEHGAIPVLQKDRPPKFYDVRTMEVLV